MTISSNECPANQRYLICWRRPIGIHIQVNERTKVVAD
jgi:hypothetical protein